MHGVRRFMYNLRIYMTDHLFLRKINIGIINLKTNKTRIKSRNMSQNPALRNKVNIGILLYA